MWCSKVLVAYDGSAPSAKALHLARSIGAQDESVELVFAHVVKLYGLGTGAETVLLDEAKKVLVEMEQLADEVPNKAHAHLLKGSSPADLLLKCAQDEGCDLIVMGSRGQGGVNRNGNGGRTGGNFNRGPRPAANKKKEGGAQ